MTDAQIKEQLSTGFISILASNAGFKVDFPRLDFGVDLSVKQIDQADRGGRTRYFESGLSLDFQMKSSTSILLSPDSDVFKMDLPVKNYNDLIWRMQKSVASKKLLIPLILIDFLLPNDRNLWVETPKSFDKIILNGKAFWFRPSFDAQISENKHFQMNQIVGGWNFFKL